MDVSHRPYAKNVGFPHLGLDVGDRCVVVNIQVIVERFTLARTGITGCDTQCCDGFEQAATVAVDAPIATMSGPTGE